ncbi:hypothetical protein H4W33_000175 [Kibdelosporangium phytohabitans]|nr:hypothetical protein [Kibdelosporangium phytohabitans]
MLKDATGSFDAGFLVLIGLCGVGAVLVVRRIPVPAG